METFKLQVPSYGYGRYIGQVLYQYLGTQLITIVNEFLVTNWGSGSSSRGVTYGHFNAISDARSHLRDTDTELFVSKTIPALKSIRDDLLSEEGRRNSMASEREYKLFIRDFNGYLEATLSEIDNTHWLGLRVQEHFRSFAGELDIAWARARRLDPDQPVVNTKFFHKLAGLRDRVFEEISAANVNIYLEEVERLRNDSYGIILSYVQNQAREEARLRDYDSSAIEKLEVELSVEALWLEQAHG